MRIDWIVPCRYAEVQPDGTLTISGAGIDTFWLPDDGLPGDLAMLLATRIVGSSEEVTEPHDLVVQLMRPDGHIERVASIRFQAEPPIAALPWGDAPLSFPLAIRFNATEFGQYRFDIALDVSGDEQHVPFAVRPSSEQPRVEPAAPLAERSS